jgi:hypothetical protein
VKKQKLSYRFHDPNTAAQAADILLRLFAAADSVRAEQTLRQSADASGVPGTSGTPGGRSGKRGRPGQSK